MTFSTRLSELMKEKKITAYRVGIDLNVSQSSVKNWLSGTNIPNGEKLQALAKYFGVSVSYLFNETDSPTPPNNTAPYISPDEYEFVTKILDLPPEKRKAIETLING